MTGIATSETIQPPELSAVMSSMRPLYVGKEDIPTLHEPDITTLRLQSRFAELT
jgi:hypothetical protein